MKLRQILDWFLKTGWCVCIMLCGLLIQSSFAQSNSPTQPIPVRLDMPSEWHAAALEQNGAHIPVHLNGHRHSIPIVNLSRFKREPTPMILEAEVSVSVVRVSFELPPSILLDRVLDYLATTVPLIGLGHNSFSLSPPQKWSGNGLEGWQVDMHGVDSEVNRFLVIPTPDAIVLIGARYRLQKDTSRGEAEENWKIILKGLKK